MNRTLIAFMLALCSVVSAQVELSGYDYLAEGDSTVFYVSDQSMDWYSAHTAAVLAGGHLATFASIEENLSVLSELGAEGVWLGLFQDSLGLEPDGGWRWSGEGPVVFTNWDDSDPNDSNGGEDCGSGIGFFGSWQDQGCHLPFRYVLEVQTVVFGCTDSSACNYNPEANEDDGSCLIVDLGEDIETCEDSLILDAGEGFDYYHWNTGDTVQELITTESFTYNVSASLLGDWIWTSGEELSVTYWNSIVLNPYALCAEMYDSDGFMAESCDLEKYFVLELPDLNEPISDPALAGFTYVDPVYMAAYNAGLTTPLSSNYYLSNEQASFYAAQDICESYGGHLVAINSEAENEFVANIDGAYFGCGNDCDGFWIGLQRAICTVTDEIFVDFDDCDAFCGEGTVWDEDLQECIAFCDDESDDIVCDCPMQPEIEGFVLFGAFEGSFYYYAADAVSWFEADSMSQANAGHLVTIGSQQERDFINDQLPWEEPTWIGLTQNLMSEEYSEPDGGWEWVTQEPLNYTDWGLNEPNEASSGEDFGMTIRGFGWNDGHPATVPLEGTPWGFVMEIECCLQGCTNPMACNYQLEANIDDGSCVSCETLASACGEGTVWDPFNQECIVAIPTDTDFDGCVTAGDVLNLLATFGTCPPIPFSGPCQGQDHVTYEGHDYEIVAIGEQCWFAENARHLPEVSSPTSGSEYDGLPHAYVYDYYGSSVTDAQMHSNFSEFGALYNFQAVIEWQLCPVGWHVSNSSDWYLLVDNFGGISEAGPALMSTYGWVWDNEGNGTNISGFNGKPAGDRNVPYDTFYSQGRYGFFWTSDAEGSGANMFILRSLSEGNAVGEMVYPSDFGISVRCIKDQ
jgi:uncharacterized protein (TIGR02145 family)